jgi:magnesium chelatase family protein
VPSLKQLVAVFRGDPVPEIEPIEVAGKVPAAGAGRQLDLADVVGQVEAKRAVEVAAAGRHQLMSSGPPGVGKTMMSERVPGLRPDLSLAVALEVSAGHSLASLDLADGLITRPPYSDPHHSPPSRASSAAAPGWPSRAPSPAPTAGSCSWTR